MFTEHNWQEISSQDTVELSWEYFWILKPERILYNALDEVLG